MAAVEGESERISIGDIIAMLDARGFGLATLLFALPSCVPMPPGVPTVVGVALLIISLQMVMGLKDLWLPRALTRRSFSRPALVGGLNRIRPRIEAIEKVAKPRLLWMTGPIATRLVGLVILILALVLILPLPPGGNFPPAFAAAVLGLGLAERDGWIVGLGLAASTVALVAMYFLAVYSLRLIAPLF